MSLHNGYDASPSLVRYIKDLIRLADVRSVAKVEISTVDEFITSPPL